MTEQLSIFDTFPEAIRQEDVPEMWECMKTCARANIYTDLFPISGGKRCLYGLQMDGTSGKHMITKIKDNVWHCWCKYYTLKGEK